MTNSTDISVRILYEWNETSSQTTSFTPAGSAVALIDWTILPLPIDEGVPEHVIRVVAEMAVSMGTVAFRLFFKDNLPNGLTIHPAPRAWVGQRVVERMRRSWPADIAIAMTPEATAELFSQDWHLQGQTALVLRGHSLSDESMNRLRHTRDWRDQAFPAEAKLLIAPAVDGEGVLLAAGHQRELEEAVEGVVSRLVNAGVNVVIDGAA